MGLKTKLVALLACSLICSCAGAPEPPRTLRVEQVINGHSIIVTFPERFGPVRLLGVVAPGPNEPFYQESIKALRKLALGKEVVLEGDAAGSSPGTEAGEIHAYVYQHGVNVNLQMVRDGWCMFVPSDGVRRLAAQFGEAQDHARKEKLGIWSE